MRDITEAFWNMARANIVTLSDLRQWVQVVQGPLTPLVQDADFLAQATNALPPAPWDGTTWASWINTLKTQTGRKGKELFLPLRLALTGVEHGPEMKLLLPMIGEKRARGLLAGKAI